MKKILLLIAILISTTIFGQRILVPSLTGNAGVQTKASTTVKTISWTTESVSAAYTPTSIVNTGGDLTWEATGAVTEGPYVLSGNNLPTFNLSTSGGGTTTITVSSSTAFVGLTRLY